MISTTMFTLSSTAMATSVAATATEVSFAGVLTDVFNSMFLEISFLIFFVLGFGLLRLDKVVKSRKNKGLTTSAFATKMKILRGEYQAGNHAAALTAWREVVHGSFTECCPMDVLRMITHSILVEGGKGSATGLVEIATYVMAFSDPFTSMGESSTTQRRNKPRNAEEGVTAILNLFLHTCATRGSIPVNEAFDELQGVMNARTNLETYEALLSAYANAGDEQRVQETMDAMRASARIISPRAYVVTATGFLRAHKVDVGRKYIAEMCDIGCAVPHYLMSEVVKCTPSGHMGAVVDDICSISDKSGMQLTSELIAMILEDAVKTKDIALGERVAAIAKERGITYLYSMYDSMIKLHAYNGDSKGIDFFEEMVAAGFTPTEGSCVAFITSCAESKFLKMAERIVAYRRERNEMSLSVYSSLMKVYAYSKLYDRACDLYEDVLADNVEPDAIMIGCLMNFAARAGRSELSEELFKKSKFPAEVQNYMSQIRSCRQSRDVHRALRLLAEMRTKMIADRTALNSVLDVCVCAREMQEAEKLFEEMRTSEQLDIIAYNTLIKGHCVNADMDGALRVLAKIKEDGLIPNDVTYNNVLNTYIGRRDFSGAWKFYLTMKADGIQEDSYTVSTLTKVLKQCNDQTFVRNVLGMLDATELDLTSDEVLLSVVLDAFIRLKDTRRLNRLMDKLNLTKLNISIATTNVLIKALSILKRIDEAKVIWHEMTEGRGMMPNEISIGCMIDALVSNDLPEQAADLATKWGSKIPLNCIIYSTLIKGFAIARNADRALELYAHMKENNVAPNLVTLNTLIDACGRSNRMDKCAEIMEEMQSDTKIAPDRITYATLVKGFCLQGDIDQGIAVMESARRRGFPADVIIYNTILDGCVQRDRFAQADEMYERLLSDGVTPSNFTLTVLIKRYGREGKVQKAFDIANSVPATYGFSMNTQTATCLVSCCLTNKQLPRALKVFEKMKKEGPTPDAHTYEKIIVGCVRGGDAERACALVQDAYGLNGPIGKLGGNSCFPSGAVTPGGSVSRVSGLNAGVLEKMVDQLSAKGLAESHCIPLVHKLRSAGVKVPQRLVAATLCGAISETRNGKSAPWKARKH